VVANPVDVLTDLVCHISGLPPGRVFGTGTVLDTARFRARLGTLVGVSPRSIHGYVLGEHGESEVLVWSSVAVGGIPLAQFAFQVGQTLTPEVCAAIDEGVRAAGAKIIKGKGATYYGIGGAVCRIVRAMRDNEDAVLTVSAPSPELGQAEPVCLSLPRVIGAGGIGRTLFPALSTQEQRELERSAGILRESARQLGL
jgi:L-lactate dehydrogenase